MMNCEEWDEFRTRSWLDNPMNEPDRDTDDHMDRDCYREASHRLIDIMRWKHTKKDIIEKRPFLFALKQYFYYNQYD